MKKILLLSLAVLSVHAAVAENLQTALDKIAKNRAKITSEIAKGELTVAVSDEQDNMIQTTTQDIVLYLKQPDKIKIVVTTPDGTGVTITQMGDVICQKMSDTGAVSRQKVTENRNLFKQYLGYGVEKMLEHFFIVSSNPITGGRTEYVLQPGSGTQAIDRYIIRIDNITGLLLYETFYRQGTQLMEIEKEYVLQDSIHVLKKMTVRVRKDGMKMETTFHYRTIDINTPVLDREFELQ